MSIFGHNSALGNFGVKGSLGLLVMFVQRQIIYPSSNTERDLRTTLLSVFIYSKKRKPTLGSNNSFSIFLSFPYIQYSYLSGGAVLCSRQRLLIFWLSIEVYQTLFNSIVSEFLTLLFKDQPAGFLDYFFLARFQDLLSLFSLSLQFSLCHRNIS